MSIDLISSKAFTELIKCKYSKLLYYPYKSLSICRNITGSHAPSLGEYLAIVKYSAEDANKKCSVDDVN